MVVIIQLLPIVITFLLVVTGVADATPRRAPPSSIASLKALTTLRTSNLSYVRSTKRGQEELTFLSVTVKNIGDVIASQVQVIAQFPGGIEIPLRGPKNILAHGKALYTSSSKMPLVTPGRVAAIATCEVCR